MSLTFNETYKEITFSKKSTSSARSITYSTMFTADEPEYFVTGKFNYLTLLAIANPELKDARVVSAYIDPRASGPYLSHGEIKLVTRSGGDFVDELNPYNGEFYYTPGSVPTTSGEFDTFFSLVILDSDENIFYLDIHLVCNAPASAPIPSDNTFNFNFQLTHGEGFDDYDLKSALPDGYPDDITFSFFGSDDNFYENIVGRFYLENKRTLTFLAFAVNEAEYPSPFTSTVNIKATTNTGIHIGYFAVEMFFSANRTPIYSTTKFTFDCEEPLEFILEDHISNFTKAFCHNAEKLPVKDFDASLVSSKGIISFTPFKIVSGSYTVVIPIIIYSREKGGEHKISYEFTFVPSSNSYRVPDTLLPIDLYKGRVYTSFDFRHLCRGVSKVEIYNFHDTNIDASMTVDSRLVLNMSSFLHERTRHLALAFYPSSTDPTLPEFTIRYIEINVRELYSDTNYCPRYAGLYENLYPDGETFTISPEDGPFSFISGIRDILPVTGPVQPAPSSVNLDGSVDVSIDCPFGKDIDPSSDDGYRYRVNGGARSSYAGFDDIDSSTGIATFTSSFAFFVCLGLRNSFSSRHFVIPPIHRSLDPNHVYPPLSGPQYDLANGSINCKNYTISRSVGCTVTVDSDGTNLKIIPDSSIPSNIAPSFSFTAEFSGNDPNHLVRPWEVTTGNYVRFDIVDIPDFTNGGIRFPCPINHSLFFSGNLEDFFPGYTIENYVDRVITTPHGIVTVFVDNTLKYIPEDNFCGIDYADMYVLDSEGLAQNTFLSFDVSDGNTIPSYLPSSIRSSNSNITGPSTGWVSGNSTFDGVIYTFSSRDKYVIDETFPHVALSSEALVSSSPDVIFGGSNVFYSDYVMVSAANGFYVAYNWRHPSNTLYLSDIGNKSSWPSKYQVSLTGDIRYVKVFSNALVVFTSLATYVYASSHPKSFNGRLIDSKHPLMAIESVISSPKGLIFATASGIKIIPMSMGTVNNLFPECLSANSSEMKYPQSFLLNGYKITSYDDFFFIDDRFSFSIDNPSATLSSFDPLDTSSTFTTSMSTTPRDFKPTHIYIETKNMSEKIEVIFSIYDKLEGTKTPTLISFNINTNDVERIKVPNMARNTRFTITFNKFSLPITNVLIGTSIDEIKRGLK